jgi:hypothetical protein
MALLFNLSYWLKFAAFLLVFVPGVAFFAWLAFGPDDE